MIKNQIQDQDFQIKFKIKIFKSDQDFQIRSRFSNQFKINPDFQINSKNINSKNERKICLLIFI